MYIRGRTIWRAGCTFLSLAFAVTQIVLLYTSEYWKTTLLGDTATGRLWKLVNAPPNGLFRYIGEHNPFPFMGEGVAFLCLIATYFVYWGLLGYLFAVVTGFLFTNAKDDP